MTRLVWAVILGVAPLLTGCAVRPVVTAQSAPPRLDRPHESYRLEPGDAIQIRYPHHPEMTQDDVIRPDGKINAKLVGQIQAAGLTKDELGTLLAKRTSDQLKDPEVVVSVTRYSEKLIYVGGEVVRPGTLPYRKGLTALQAIAEAGGFRDTARADSVIIVRAGATERSFIAHKVNLDIVTLLDAAQEPFTLAPHDVLFVPRTEIADANVWIRQHLTDTIPLFRGIGDPDFGPLPWPARLEWRQGGTPRWVPDVPPGVGPPAAPPR